jgi:hypothetical protein
VLRSRRTRICHRSAETLTKAREEKAVGLHGLRLTLQVWFRVDWREVDAANGSGYGASLAQGS